jgi:hypothetical protein
MTSASDCPDLIAYLQKATPSLLFPLSPAKSGER